MGCVYCATNVVNGKKYIGKTVRALEHRRSCHERDALNESKFLFHCAIRKYGKENFTWSILFQCDTESALFAAERDAIVDQVSKVPNGYNLTDGGEGVAGYTYTAEVRAKIGAASRGKVYSAETCAKIGAVHKGKVVSVETRAKIGAVNRGRTPSAETRAKLSAAGKISAANREVCSAETRAKLSAAHRGKALSDEHKAKIGAAMSRFARHRREENRR